MNYESPIKVIYDDFVKEVTRKFDDTVIAACQNVNIVVDKEELAKALAYDRKQYEKGYQEGVKSQLRDMDWIPVSMALPGLGKEVLVTTSWGDLELACLRLCSSVFTEYEWVFTSSCIECDSEDIVAWMPLPEPYEVKEE